MNNANDYKKDINIFLNIFDLSLEEGELDPNSKLSIYDKDNNVVGCLNVDEGDIRLFANIGKNNLDVSYEIPEILSIADYEDEYNCYESHCSDFDFVLDKEDGTNLSGMIQISVSSDTRIGNKVSVHPHIKINNNDNKRITLDMKRNGNLFFYEEKDDIYIDGPENVEQIYISPYGNYSGYLVHNKKNSKLDKSSGIFPKNIDEQYNLHLFSHEKTGRYDNKVINHYTRLVGELDDEASIIQLGNLMKKLDKDMYKKISKIKEDLNFENIELFDNLITNSLDNYSNDEVYSLIGVNKNDSLNDYENLTEFYFDNSKEKKLIKK
jgi:hypothetical protein